MHTNRPDFGNGAAQMDHFWPEVIHGDPGGGNTRTPPGSSDSSPSSISRESDPKVRSSEGSKKRTKEIAPRKFWCFTWHDYPTGWQEQFSCKQGLIDGYIIGEEKCPNTGRRHLQGWISFATKDRPTKLKLPKQIHWEGAKGNPSENYVYCTKEGQFIAWGRGKAAKPWVPKCELSPWQLKLAEMLDGEIDDRAIWWLWEPMGKAGKTSFQKWYEYHHKGDVLLLSGKATDMKNGIIEHLDKHGNIPRIVMCNVPRSTDDRFISYQGLEEVKDMLFYSGKFHGGMVNDRPPHLFMFGNWEPCTDSMSGDRWNIVRLPDGRGEGEIKRHDWRNLA